MVVIFEIGEFRMGQDRYREFMGISKETRVACWGNSFNAYMQDKDQMGSIEFYWEDKHNRVLDQEEWDNYLHPEDTVQEHDPFSSFATDCPGQLEMVLDLIVFHETEQVLDWMIQDGTWYGVDQETGEVVETVNTNSKPIACVLVA